MSTPIDRRAFVRDAARLTALGSLALTGAPRAAAALTRGLAAAPAGERTFNMLVLGDSILWGQGLDDDSKFTHRVQVWLQTHLGRTVRRDVFAHSGAVLAPNAQADARPPKPGEIPDAYPSIPRQIEVANAWLAAHPITDAEHAAPLERENIHLVLIDGGINDVHVANILTVDPTITDAVGWVRKLTRERCPPRMRALLQRVLATYPNAKVVVTGYYPIVSDQTDLGDLERLLRMFGLIGGVLDRAVDSALRSKLGAQSRAFHDTYMAEVPRVVREVSSGEVVLAGLSRYQKSPAPVPVSQQPGRCAFADVAFGPEHSFGAPSTLLFGVNAHDPAASTRATQCQQVGRSADPTCYWASAGHPNPAGAARYAAAVERALERFLPEWGGKVPRLQPGTGIPVRRP